jgi:hypothetical protein
VRRGVVQQALFAFVDRGSRRSRERAPRSDRRGQLVECGSDAQLFVSSVDAEFVVASSEVLDEGVAADDHARGAVGPEAAYRS